MMLNCIWWFVSFMLIVYIIYLVIFDVYESINVGKNVMFNVSVLGNVYFNKYFYGL